MELINVCGGLECSTLRLNLVMYYLKIITTLWNLKCLMCCVPLNCIQISCFEANPVASASPLPPRGIKATGKFSPESILGGNLSALVFLQEFEFGDHQVKNNKKVRRQSDWEKPSWNWNLANVPGVGFHIAARHRFSWCRAENRASLSMSHYLKAWKYWLEQLGFFKAFTLHLVWIK